MKKEVRFGPVGIGKLTEIEHTFKIYSELGFTAVEIPFTYGVYIKKDQHKEEIQLIKKLSKKLGISLSIHAPYWINLNSLEKEKIEASKKRILDSCEIANLIGAKRVVFHSGFYGKGDREGAYQNIKKRIQEMLNTIKKKKWDVLLCPETMGKINVFGSLDEISRLKDETGCSFCIDFSHNLARYKEYKFELVREKFTEKSWHCHFSGIEYGEKGEKKHKRTSREELSTLFKHLPKDKDINIISESPDPAEDSVLALKIWKKFEHK
jgi:deoxyribonuclease IV